MSKGFVVAEQGHVVQMIAPVNIAAPATSDTISMENWGHVSILCGFGIGSTTTITVAECTSFAGSGRTAIAFRYAQEATHPGDVLDAALAWATAGGVVITGSVAAPGGFALIEIDGDELSDGYQFLQVNIADPGAGRLGSVHAILSGGRYQEDITATAIA